MADKIVLDNVSKLRPELLTMSVAELERRRTEIDMALAQKAEAEREAKRAAALDEANRLKDDIVDALVKLEKTGHISERVRSFFTTKDGTGVFAPHLFFKKAKS